MIPHQDVLIQQKIPVKTQCCWSQYLLNVKCKDKFNILIYSQKSNLFTYLKKEEGFYTKLSYFLNFKWETEILSFHFDIAFNLLFVSTFLQILQDTPHQVKDYLRSYCSNSLDLCRKSNLKNIALTTWVTLEKNRVSLIALHISFLDTLLQDPHFLKRLCTVNNVTLHSL